MNFTDLLDECESNCNSIDDFNRRLKGEYSRVSKINSGTDYAERKDLMGNVEYTLNVIKTGLMVKENYHNSQIRRILDKLK